MTHPEMLIPAFSSTADRVSTGEDKFALIPPFLNSEHGPFHCLMAGIAISLSVILAVLFRLEHISVVNLHPISFTFECAVPAAAIAIYCHWAGHAKLRDGCWMVLWASVFFRLLQLPQYAAARSGLPLQDAALVHMDRLIGIDGGAIISFVQRHPGFEAFSISSYGLMPWMVFAAVLIPPMFGQLRRAKEYLLATIMASALAAFILALNPVVGPWAGFDFHPYWNQAWYTHELNSLRSVDPFTANPDYTCGLITFPSFHVALAVLGVFALWPFRWLRILALVVAALIAIATVTTGWHYASDGIGGIAIAAIGIALARRFVDGRKAGIGSDAPDFRGCSRIPPVSPFHATQERAGLAQMLVPLHSQESK
jgi:membrane-associated phospholipid phosphatase